MKIAILVVVFVWLSLAAHMIFHDLRQNLFRSVIRRQYNHRGLLAALFGAVVIGLLAAPAYTVVIARNLFKKSK